MRARTKQVILASAYADTEAPTGLQNAEFRSASASCRGVALSGTVCAQCCCRTACSACRRSAEGLRRASKQCICPCAAPTRRVICGVELLGVLQGYPAVHAPEYGGKMVLSRLHGCLFYLILATAIEKVISIGIWLQKPQIPLWYML